MDIQLLAEYLKTFIATYPVEEKNEVWKKQSLKFREFWNNRIMKSNVAELVDDETDEIIKILDSHGKGKTKDSEVIAAVLIPQGAFRRLFKQLQKNKNFAECIDKILKSDSAEERIKQINHLYDLNKNNIKYLTGASGNAISCLLAAFDPFVNLSIVSLNDRLKLIRRLGLGYTPDQDSIGARIVKTNDLIISFFKDSNNLDNARTISSFAYSSNFLKEWKPPVIKEKSTRKISSTDQVNDNISGNDYNSQASTGLRQSEKYKSDFPLNTIFYGPPGTGKTYNTIIRAAQIIEQRNISDYREAQKIFNENLGSQIEFITFHQNYSYEDFIQGLRPDIENNSELHFVRKDGVFKRIAERALKNLKDSERPEEATKNFDEVFYEFIENLIQEEVKEIEVPMKTVSFFINNVGNKSIEFRKNKGDSRHSLSIETLRKIYEKKKNDLIIGGLQPYYNSLLNLLLEKGRKEVTVSPRKNFVLIIDEINRANISRVFGELITLIEIDKRSHGKFPLKSTLPSGEEFIVPSNLYIIGTMNTADKSIALLDIALRRRFDFEAMYPLYKIEGEEIYDVEILEKINKQIKKLKGHDFQIGHSYFMGDNTELVARMNKKVIPLLLEYFMNDEKEVKGILTSAGLSIVEESWPIKIKGLL